MAVEEHFETLRRFTDEWMVQMRDTSAGLRHQLNAEGGVHMRQHHFWPCKVSAEASKTLLPALCVSSRPQHDAVLQVAVRPLEDNSPLGLMCTTNTAFSKLATLLAYLLLQIEGLRMRVAHLHYNMVESSAMFLSISISPAQIEREMYPALLVFGDSPTAAAPEKAPGAGEGDTQIRLAKFLPSLRRLQVPATVLAYLTHPTACGTYPVKVHAAATVVSGPPSQQLLCQSPCCIVQVYLERLEAVTGNLLCQLGALSAEQTRKATILQGPAPDPSTGYAVLGHPSLRMHACMHPWPEPSVTRKGHACGHAGPHAAAAFMGLASALGVLLRLDAIIARNGQLLSALAMFRRQACIRFCPLAARRIPGSMACKSSGCCVGTCMAKASPARCVAQDAAGCRSRAGRDW